MSSLIAALDLNSKPINVDINEPNTQLGENSHLEYGWSDEVYMREKLLQIFFQLVRCDISKRKELVNKFQQLIQSAYSEYLKNDKTTRNTAIEILLNAFKMIAYTRDIINGKGEYRLGFGLLRAWYEAGFSYQNYAENFFTTSAKSLLKLFLLGVDETTHQYGSWKDVKYLAHDKYALLAANDKIKLNGYEVYATDGLLSEGVDLLVNQLKVDLDKYNTSSFDNGNKVNISLAARWVPREKSKKFGDLNKFIAHRFYNNYIKSASSKESVFRAQKKAQTEFRKNIAKLNKCLNTVQINQCKNNWKEINFGKDVTSITMNKQKKAFLNSKNKDSLDREECANNFREFLEQVQAGTNSVKGKRVFVGDFVKEALIWLNKNDMRAVSHKEHCEMLALDFAWKDNASQNKQLRNFIAMVDTSGSMESDNRFPMHSAIGLGLRIAEMSALGNRVLTFSNEPAWINLDDESSFVRRVGIVRNAPWGMNTNFYAALKMILDAAAQANMTAEEVNDLTLVVLSDMQMDEADSGFLTVENKMQGGQIYSISKSKQLDKNIDELFYQTGMSVCGQPWKRPHIVFWNLRSTNGFPSVSNKQNTTMVSGASASLLNSFCEKGVETMNDITPYKFMSDLLNHKRYEPLSSILNL